MKQLDVDGYFIMATKNGLIKRSEIREYDTSLRKRGLKALTLKEGDELVHVDKTDGNTDILLVTKDGFAVRYNEDVVKSVGRAGLGVRSMILRLNDNIVSMLVLDREHSSEVLVITENGYGKKTSSEEYRSLGGRYAKGTRTINTDSKTRNGSIVSAAVITEGSEFLVLTQKGKITRLLNDDLLSKNRISKGNKIVSLDPVDKVKSLVVVCNEI